MKTRKIPYSNSELNKRVEQYRSTQEHRVHAFRKKEHTDEEKKSTKDDRWDIPLTVCSCGSTKAPFLAANGRNCSALKMPNPILAKAYDNIDDDSGNHIGKTILPHKIGYQIIQ